MILTWMAYSLFLGVALGVAAEGLQRAARMFGRPSRFVWVSAMVVSALVPLAGYALARRAAVKGAAVVRTELAVSRTAGAIEQSPFVVSSPHLIERIAGIWSRATAGTDRFVLLLWASLTLILLARILRALVSLLRRRREWRDAVVHDVPVRVTSDIGPAVVAMPRAEILLPEWVMSLEASQVETIVRHEREHREAGDARLLLASAMLTAVLPWNLALWWQDRRLRLAVEMDCDARVLRSGSRVDRYGSLLLAIAQHRRASLFAAAALAESTSDLERRIEAMTSPTPSSPRRAAALPVAGVLLAIGFACATPAPDVVVAPPAAKDTGVFDFHVTRQAHPANGNPAPDYPAQLRAAHIEGNVVVKVVIDSTGHANIGSLVVLRSDHELFTSAVRQVLPRMAFVPAEISGRKVQQLITMPFVFSLDGEAAGRLSEVPVATTKPRDIDDAQMVLRDSAPVRTVGHQGRVTLQFKVRPDGSPDLGSSTSVQSDDPRFLEAARQAIDNRRLTFPGKSSARMSVVFLMPLPGNLVEVPADSVRAVRAIGPSRITMKPGSIPSRDTSRAVTRKPVRDSGGATMPEMIAAELSRPYVHRVTDTIPAEALSTNPPPIYPNQLRAANIEGTVILQFDVLKDGSVDERSIGIVKSGHPLFENAVLNAITHYRFRPATLNGQPVPWKMALPFAFTVSK